MCLTHSRNGSHDGREDARRGAVYSQQGKARAGKEPSFSKNDNRLPGFITWEPVRVYQITTLLEGARYIPSVFFTLKAVYHSGKFLGGILARRQQGPWTSTCSSSA